MKFYLKAQIIDVNTKILKNFISSLSLYFSRINTFIDTRENSALDLVNFILQIKQKKTVPNKPKFL